MPLDWLGQHAERHDQHHSRRRLEVLSLRRHRRACAPADHSARSSTRRLHIDGAGAWSRFWDVTLPQLREVLIVIVLLRTIWDFKEFDLIYLLTGGGPVTSTQTLPLLVYKQAFGLNAMGKASTYAVGMMVVHAHLHGALSLPDAARRGGTP